MEETAEAAKAGGESGEEAGGQSITGRKQFPLPSRSALKGTEPVG